MATEADLPARLSPEAPQQPQRAAFLRRVRGLLEDRRLAVLATFDGRRPHTTLIAYACSQDLRSLYFATARQTRKYEHMLAVDQVSLLIDDRTETLADFADAVAVSAVGRAVELTGSALESAGARFLERMPQLTAYLSSPSTALIEVRVARYDLVQRFQDVQVLELEP